MDQTYIVICKPLRFYTQTDETYCFKWIKKIKSVIAIEGIGSELHLHVKSMDISKKDLLELVGLFRRYNFDLQPLRIFLNDGNKIIFEALFSKKEK